MLGARWCSSCPVVLILPAWGARTAARASGGRSKSAAVAVAAAPLPAAAPLGRAPFGSRGGGLAGEGHRAAARAPGAGAGVGAGALSALETPRSRLLGELAAAQAGAQAAASAVASGGGQAPVVSEAALVQLLQSDLALCRRIATSVDGRVDDEWALARAEAEEATTIQTAEAVPMPTRAQLLKLHLRVAVPFVGFGFFDNMIMLTVGGTIESTIGVTFCLSTLCAAGMGQMVSDASGITLQGLIERFADKMGLPHPHLTLQQERLSYVQSFVLASRIGGIVLGCCFGMFPLMFMSERVPQLVDQIAEKLDPEARCEFMSLVTQREFARGETILHFGEMSDFVFLIEEGQVEVVGRDAEGLPFHVCTMGRGHSFGKPQLHCPSQVDLVAQDGHVVVQYIEKDDFLRVAGKLGIEVWESTQQREHSVYFAAKGHCVADAVPVAKQGAGKTRFFASLSQEDRLEVLRFAGIVPNRKFQGREGEGKVAFFAHLPETVKHDALERWHEEKFKKTHLHPSLG